MAPAPGQADGGEAEARRILDRVERESGVIGESALARAAGRTSDHFAAKDAPDGDPVELWGRRIGRLLGLLFFIFMLVHLAGMVLDR